MPRLIAWFKSQSKNNKSESGDDLLQVEQKVVSSSINSNNPTTNPTHVESISSSSSSDVVNLQVKSTAVVENCCESVDELKKTTTNSSDDILIEEITLNIAQYLPLSDLNHLAQTNSHLLKLFFKSKEQSNGNSSQQDQVVESTTAATATTSEEEEEVEFEFFGMVQNIIWKPLLLYYFPKFGQDLNIKNWMHVLRRRFRHVKLHGKTSFQIDTPNFAQSLEDFQFIENCEWIYKCPLNYNQLKTPGTNTKFCNVCKKTVYLVDNMRDFKSHISKDNCVAYSTVPVRSGLKDIPVRPVMGAMRPPVRRR